MKAFKIKFWVMIVCVSMLGVNCSLKRKSNRDVKNPNTVTIPEIKSIPIAIPEEGWGPNPREVSDLKDDNGKIDISWYTKKYSGKASERAIELKSPSFMESTCRQELKKNHSKALIESAYTSVSPELKPSEIKDEDLKTVEVSNCKPKSPESSFSECECSLSYKIEGGKKAMMEKISPILKTN